MQIYADNKKAHYDYEVLDKYEAGMLLLGPEVKSIRNGKMSLSGSYVTITNGQAELIGSKIPPYQPGNTPEGYNPEKSRKLLLNKKELAELAGRANEKGFSLIPLKVYDNNGRIKLEFGLARGKKKHDKKEKIKKRDAERNTRVELGA